jgi:uncharacterized protein YbaA (DUF1428 family)
MSQYVDGFLLPVPKSKLADYRRVARKAGKIWKEHGALDYRECAGDDLDSEGFAPFAGCIKAKPNETVIFAWATFKSRKHRDKVNASLMKDERLRKMCAETGKILDCKRMAYGGFKTIVSF